MLSLAQLSPSLFVSCLFLTCTLSGKIYDSLYIMREGGHLLASNPNMYDQLYFYRFDSSSNFLQEQEFIVDMFILLQTLKKFKH